MPWDLNKASTGARIHRAWRPTKPVVNWTFIKENKLLMKRDMQVQILDVYWCQKVFLMVAMDCINTGHLTNMQTVRGRAIRKTKVWQQTSIARRMLENLRLMSTGITQDIMNASSDTALGRAYANSLKGSVTQRHSPRDWFPPLKEQNRSYFLSQVYGQLKEVDSKVDNWVCSPLRPPLCNKAFGILFFLQGPLKRGFSLMLKKTCLLID